MTEKKPLHEGNIRGQIKNPLFKDGNVKPSTSQSKPSTPPPAPQPDSKKK